MKIIQTIIDRFDGGISEDKRSKTSSKYSLTKHFDALTYPHKLVPYYTTTNVETKSQLIKDFVFAPRSASTYRLFGHGTTIGGVNSCVFMIDPTDTDATWITEEVSNAGSALSRSLGCFAYYKNFIYMWGGGTKLIRFQYDSGAAFNDAYQSSPSIAYTTIAKPVHHSADDILYLFSDNKVHTQTNSTTGFNEAVLTLPDIYKITCACAYGTYLAIGCVTKRTYDQQSVVYLWDRDSSLTTLTERIDFGAGALTHLACLDNKLIGVVNYYLDDSLNLYKAGKVIVKQASGQTTITLNEMTSDSPVSAYMSISEFIENNILYIPMAIPLNGDTRNGIWAINSNGRMYIDFVEEEVDSATTKTYQAIFKVAGYWWIAHSADGSINRTVTTRAYSSTMASIYESLIFNAGDSSLTKKLLGVEVMTEPLPSGASVVLKYRKDGDLDGSWTTIFTEATDDSVSHGAVNIESSGASLSTYKEVQFRIESLGGAVITGLKIKEEIIDKNLF